MQREEQENFRAFVVTLNIVCFVNVPVHYFHLCLILGLLWATTTACVTKRTPARRGQVDIFDLQRQFVVREIHESPVSIRKLETDLLKTRQTGRQRQEKKQAGRS